MSYKANRLAADLLLAQQKEIIAKHQSRLDFNRAKIEHTFKVDEKADCEENTDLFFFEYRKLRIACRVRFDISSSKYGDITIRSRFGNGKTEIDKINDGYGDYMLYCWGDKENIKEYMIIDLDVFRESQNEFFLREKVNHDGMTSFYTYDINKILKTPCCVVANLKI